MEASPQETERRRRRRTRIAHPCVCLCDSTQSLVRVFCTTAKRTTDSHDDDERFRVGGRLAQEVIVILHHLFSSESNSSESTLFRGLPHYFLVGRRCRRQARSGSRVSKCASDSTRVRLNIPIRLISAIGLSMNNCRSTLFLRNRRVQYR